MRGAVGIRTIGWDYPVTAIVATILHEKPHDAVAHEFFLPNGPFAILPLKGERSNIVWAEPRAAGELNASQGREFALQRAYFRLVSSILGK